MGGLHNGPGHSVPFSGGVRARDRGDSDPYAALQVTAPGRAETVVNAARLSQRETHQVMQAASKTIDASAQLTIPSTLVSHVSSGLATGPRHGSAAAAESPGLYYSTHDLQLLTDIVQQAEQTASSELQQGVGSGQVRPVLTEHCVGSLLLCSEATYPVLICRSHC